MRVLEDIRKFIKNVYCIKYIEDEKFGLQSQIRRAVVSISLNIAEGNGRDTKKDYLRFVYQSKGSLKEVQECIRITNELYNLDLNIMNDLINESIVIEKQINSLIKYLRYQIQNPTPNINNQERSD